MARSNQRRDRFGRFADEGKGDFTDAALVARSRKRIERWKAQQLINTQRAIDANRVLDAKISFEQSRIDSLT